MALRQRFDSFFRQKQQKLMRRWSSEILKNRNFLTHPNQLAPRERWLVSTFNVWVDFFYLRTEVPPFTLHFVPQL